MATELELALFAEELREVELLPEAKRWELERDDSVPLGLFAVMHSIRKNDDLYKARLRWNDYFAPFSLKFINIETGADNDPAAWPKCFGFRPASLDVCLPWTEEGQRLHPEWATSATQAFPRVEVPMQHALLRIQHSLDTSYEGRGSK